MACELALICNAQAGETESKEEVISTVSGTMAAMVMPQGAKNCFYEVWMMVFGYDFKERPELLRQVSTERDV